MKVFITGGTGLLGSALIRSKPSAIRLYASYYNNMLIPAITDCSFHHLNICNKNEVKDVLRRIKPNVIIHTAAKSSPDFCESNKKIAWQTNVIGTRNVLTVAEELRARVLFTSSNQVFSGKNPPYAEEAKRDPVNYYGKTKMESENDILTRNHPRNTVLRLMTMYGWGNPKGQKNTAMWVIESLSESKAIKVVDDVYNNFLWVGQSAEIIWKIVASRKKISLIQIAGGEVGSRYSFAEKVASTFHLDTNLITPVKKNYFKDEAPRPLNTIYTTALCERLFSVKLLTIQSGLRKMKSEKNRTKWRQLVSKQ